jgi:hypothetical protein
MGQSLYLCFGSAGFCCWGLGMGLPFPSIDRPFIVLTETKPRDVKAWGGTAQITTHGAQRYPFSGHFQISGNRGT